MFCILVLIIYMNLDAYYCKGIVNWSFNEKLSWLYQRDQLIKKFKVSFSYYLQSRIPNSIKNLRRNDVKIVIGQLIPFAIFPKHFIVGIRQGFE